MNAPAPPARSASPRFSATLGEAPPASLEAFRAAALAAGFDEVLEREWAPGTVVGTHMHDFDVDAVVVRGEMWLGCAGRTEHLRPGDRFRLARNEPHDERYGPEGAAYWVARRNARG